VAASVQAPAPARRAGRRRRTFTLAIDHIHPTVRIAHRIVGPLATAERVIRDHELVLIVRGRATYVSNGRLTPLPAGSLLCVRPFVPHRVESGGQVVEHVAAHFDPSPDVPRFGPRVADRQPYDVRLTHGLALPLVTPVTPADGVEAAMARTVRSFDDGTLVGELDASAAVASILAHLLRSSPALPGTRTGAAATVDERNRARVGRAVAYVAEHHARPLDVATLAAVAGLSPSRFTALFRAHTGTSPMGYVRKVRVDHARRLLADVDLSIKEVAARVGFDDAFHFSKVFRAVDGLAPTRYREALLAGRG